MMSEVVFRPGTIADSYTVFIIFEHSLADLSRSFGSTTPTSAADPIALQRMWIERHSLYEHLARTCDQFWLAEREGRAIGYARSIVRAGVRQLTEMFVLPGEQSGGVGRELMSRVLPLDEDISHCSIIVSADSRAQALYLKSGLYPRFPVYYFGRKPEQVKWKGDLVFQRISNKPETLTLLSFLDRDVLGFTREIDHKWFLSDRQGYLYYRESQAVGYGYLGVRNGPFALMDQADFPAVLAHAESQAASDGRQEFGLEVPMVYRMVVDYLLRRDFKMDAFLAILMVDELFARFENYILTSPPFFL